MCHGGRCCGRGPGPGPGDSRHWQHDSEHCGTVALRQPGWQALRDPQAADSVSLGAAATDQRWRTRRAAGPGVQAPSRSLTATSLSPSWHLVTPGRDAAPRLLLASQSFYLPPGTSGAMVTSLFQTFGLILKFPSNHESWEAVAACHGSSSSWNLKLLGQPELGTGRSAGRSYRAMALPEGSRLWPGKPPGRCSELGCWRPGRRVGPQPEGLRVLHSGPVLFPLTVSLPRAPADPGPGRAGHSRRVTGCSTSS
jgi:hypothetical protein